MKTFWLISPYQKQDFDKAKEYFDKAAYQCDQASRIGAIVPNKLIDSLDKAIQYFKQNKIKGKTRAYTAAIKKLKNSCLGRG